MRNFPITLNVTIEAETLEEAMTSADNMATGLGITEETSAEANLGLYHDIAEQLDADSPFTPEQVAQRVYAMHRANREEDVKWAIQDLEEDS